MTILLIFLASSLIYLAPSLWQTWTHDGATLVNQGGFVTGHDFVAFYAASKAVWSGDAAMVYDRDFMMAAQIEIVGAADIGYLAFMYPPTYLLLVAPLATLPYFPALALWQALPFVLFLLALRRIALPPIALVMAAGAPAIAQVLFAGQNGLLFALFLGVGLMALDRRPLAAGLLLGLAATKPQLAILLVPALIAGQNWRALAAMLGCVVALTVLSAAVFGADIWYSYLAVPGQVRDYLALGQFPWPRMPTLYAAGRLSGLPHTASMILQVAGALTVVAGIVWTWRKAAPTSLRITVLLAGAPLATPFMYDYDLPFMLIALGLYLAEALGRSQAWWERYMLLLVWLQPVWWWYWITSSTGVSIAPLVYASFFAAAVYRTRAAS
ncbi:MAG: DUF2029 domain-containing protein [Gammaproteobacteria bacterium]|nr:DUF2029 domain-containing protein [Gammaproteobacteria bacterium]